MDRDFKGVWIPKEIWLHKDLSMLEKVLLTEICSLDNENHCTAGNEYFAEFCNCSISAISKAIKHLKDIGFLEELNFNGRIRKLRVVNFTTLPSKIYEADSENLLTNNIKNNTKNKSIINNTTKKSSKKSVDKLKESCRIKINGYTDDEEIRKLLCEFVDERIARMEEYIDYDWTVYKLTSVLKALDKFAPSQRKAIIQQSIDRGWASFYDLKKPRRDFKSFQNSEPTEGTGFMQNSEEENKKRTDFIIEMRKQGKRTVF